LQSRGTRSAITFQITHHHLYLDIFIAVWFDGKFLLVFYGMRLWWMEWG
jgi:hypothetical protein